MGSKTADSDLCRGNMGRRRTIGLVHAVVLASGAAALAAVATAIGAAFSVNNRHNDLGDFISSTSGSVVSRTLRSTSVQTRLACADQANALDSIHDNSESQKRGLSLKQNPSTTLSTLVQVKTSRLSQPASNPTVHLESKEVQDKEAEDGLGVAWLMSFPNSGTSFTLHLIREVSNTTTATNYALEGDIKDEESVPAIASSENGPYLELIKTIHTTTPHRYILTKTHCGGFCSQCSALNYIETPRSFKTSCLSGRRALLPEGGSELEVKQVQYDASIVKKAVHVIRSPFNNIVARFHLEQKRHQRVSDTEWLINHPNDKVGFQKWCAEVDSSNDLMEARWVDSDLSAALKGVPCHAEFYRYVQWHNLAFTAARDMGIPTFVLHYEDYRDDFEGTVEKLLDFLELPKVKGGPEFALGKEYEDYYTNEQREAIATLAEELSSVETWQHLQDYYFTSKSVK